MKKYLVIGNPIEHSLSPKLHNHWIKENNIDAIYDKKQLSKNEIKGEGLEFKCFTKSTFIPLLYYKLSY